MDMRQAKHLVVRTNERPWLPGFFPNSEFKPLWAHEDGRQAFIVRFGPGGSIPFHDHPGREYALVLDGEMLVSGERLGPGDFLTAGAGELHDVQVHEQVTFFIVIENSIAVVEQSSDNE